MYSPFNWQNHFAIQEGNILHDIRLQEEQRSLFVWLEDVKMRE